MSKRKKILRGVLLLLAVAVLGILITSGIIWAHDMGEGDRINEDFGIKASVENAAPISLDFVVDRIGEHPPYLAIIPDGTGYIIEKATLFGWRKVDLLEDWRTKSDAVERVLGRKEGQSSSFKVRWDDYYGELPKGTYRIGLTVYNPSFGGDKSGYCYATFKISE